MHRPFRYKNIPWLTPGAIAPSVRAGIPRSFQCYSPLVVGKKAVKLETAPANIAAGKASFAGKIFLGAVDQGTFAISGHGVSLSRLADQLSDLLRVLVHDRTGLTQNYFFNFRFQRPDTTGGVGTESEAPTLFDALETKLGLKLEKSRGLAEILVIDLHEPLRGRAENDRFFASPAVRIAVRMIFLF